MSTSDDDALPDTALPDTAMASGSDAGTPGEHLGPGDLSPDEQRLLDALEAGVGGGPAGTAEESIAAVRAAEDEGPLPAHGGAQDDGLSVVFDPPRED
jgi:hypothetical protein